MKYPHDGLREFEDISADFSQGSSHAVDDADSVGCGDGDDVKRFFRHGVKFLESQASADHFRRICFINRD